MTGATDMAEALITPQATTDQPCRVTKTIDDHLLSRGLASDGPYCNEGGRGRRRRRQVSNNCQSLFFSSSSLSRSSSSSVGRPRCSVAWSVPLSLVASSSSSPRETEKASSPHLVGTVGRSVGWRADGRGGGNSEKEEGKPAAVVDDAFQPASLPPFCRSPPLWIEKDAKCVLSLSLGPGPSLDPFFFFWILAGRLCTLVGMDGRTEEEEAEVVEREDD